MYFLSELSLKTVEHRVNTFYSVTAVLVVYGESLAALRCGSIGHKNRLVARLSQRGLRGV